ncbi:MAG: hypothetical protein HYX87_02385 [Chloroflexi bacterium]|nr:hypothetical protein [Chloroflexota bacterium]
MVIETIRDIVIIVAGLLMIFLFIGIAVGSFLLYKKVNRVINAVKNTATTAQAVVTSIADAIKPLIVLSAFIRRLRRRGWRQRHEEGEKEKK